MYKTAYNCSVLPKYHIQKTSWESTYLNMEISQSQEWLDRPMKKQIAANIHTAITIVRDILETIWVPRCKSKRNQLVLLKPIFN